MYLYLYLYLYRRSGTILQDVVVVQVVQVVFHTDCCGHTWAILGWDGMRMGWDGLGTVPGMYCFLGLGASGGGGGG